MKVALAQINPVVGDVIGNTEKILARIEEARRAGASLVVFSEMAVAGYPAWDLLLKPAFVRANVAAVQRIAEQCRGIAALVGFVEPNAEASGRSLRNAAAYCADGEVRAVRYKSLLPTYDVFDERRYFEPGPEVAIIDHAGVPVGVSICEDLWNDEQLVGRQLYRADPVGQLAAAGAKFLVNLSASPYARDKHPFRVKLFGGQARKHALPILFVNQVGGNDELVFDGASGAFDAAGNLIAQAKAFEEDLLLVELLEPTSEEVGHPLNSTGCPDDPDRPSIEIAPPINRIEPYPDSIASMHDALALGTRDYVLKCGFKHVVIGLSGGIDSAVTAALAVAGLGKEAVTGVSMPSRFSSEHSKTDAEAVAANLGIDFRLIPIKSMHDSIETHLQPQFAGRPPDITEENLQARLRGLLLMALSNKFGWLVLTTGNKSELAVGYCTLYGDMCGGLAVIGDVPKMHVYELARYINTRARGEVIPENTIVKPPSAELRPDQTDQDSLPPYALLDELIDRYVTQEQSLDEIIAAGHDAETARRVIRLIDTSEYKRKQAASVIKVTSRAFGVGRRMPIAARFRY